MRSSDDFWCCHEDGCVKTFIHGRFLATHLELMHNGGTKYPLRSTGPRPSPPASSGHTAAD